MSASNRCNGQGIRRVAVCPAAFEGTCLLAWINSFKNSKSGGSIGWFERIFTVAPLDWISCGLVPIIICLSPRVYACPFIPTFSRGIGTFGMPA